MRGVSALRVAASVESDRTDIRDTEQSFGSILGDVSRLLWPAKTAAHLAAAAGCSERAAEFYLSGQREWSGDAIAAIITEVMRRHATRNIKIIPK
jgi:hypothetical protein